MNQILDFTNEQGINLHVRYLAIYVKGSFEYNSGLCRPIIWAIIYVIAFLD
jgi:hypothetical protein